MAGSSNQQSAISGLLSRFAGRGETTVLTGRMLLAVRVVVLAVFAVAVVVYTMDLFALWDEAHRFQYSVPDPVYNDPTTVNYYGLTVQEREMLTGSIADVPGWYPIFVVTRLLILEVIAVGIAWLIFTRRPRQGMAYLATLFILLAPTLAHVIRDKGLEGSLAGPLESSLEIAAILTLAAFLWLFPDGRFRAPLLGLLGVMFALMGSAAVMAWILPNQDDPPWWIRAPWFILLLASILLWAVGGIGAQIWRYRNTRIADRRLARWNLAFLIAIPLWFMPFDAFHDFYGEEDENLDTLGGFVWEQIHETVYLAAPVLMGIWVLFLVRRQGWWDFQTLWNRTAVYGIGLVLLAAVYGAAIGLVTLAASPLAATGEQVVAVIVATAIVAFSYGPVLGGVRRWVDQRWFPRRAEVDALALAFADEVRANANPGMVQERLRAVLADELDPEHVELWTVEGAERR